MVVRNLVVLEKRNFVLLALGVPKLASTSQGHRDCEEHLKATATATAKYDLRLKDMRPYAIEISKPLRLRLPTATEHAKSDCDCDFD